jgi:phenylpyruvate tautomerase PptA (4-oxalocrotonate tautomerase family)
MPVVDVQLVLAAGELVPEGAAQRLANAVARVLQAPPGRVWVRVTVLPEGCYAENDTPAAPRPVFVRVLHADAPPSSHAATEAAALAHAVAECLTRDPENVHIEYAPPGRGRVAFGGKLLE